MTAQPIPEGHSTVSPYLVVENVTECIEFAEQAFDAERITVHTRPDGSILHAEVRIGNSVVMMGGNAPRPATLHVYVKDVDAVYERALQAGAGSLREPADQFYGDRNAAVKDASGNRWWIATHVEDVPPEELENRKEALTQEQASQ